jgi:hypothetical protein
MPFDPSELCRFRELWITSSCVRDALIGRKSGTVYKANLPAKAKKQVHELLGHILRQLLEELKLQPSKLRSYSRHFDTISKIQKQIAAEPKLKLAFVNSSLKFGRCQKLVNMYLKYHWVAGKLPDGVEPPHCPIDSVVLKSLRKESKNRRRAPNTKIRWSEMDCSGYRKIMDGILECAQEKHLTPAQWEIEVYNRAYLGPRP